MENKLYGEKANHLGGYSVIQAKDDGGLDQAVSNGMVGSSWVLDVFLTDD